MRGSIQRRRLGFCAAFAVAIALDWTAGSTAMAASAKRLPPIGQRKYVLESDDPYAPVTIENAAASPREKYLKDPVQPSKEAKVIRPVRPAPKRAPVKQVARPGRLQFKKMSVNGYLKRPRVEFARDVLPVGRADEPLPEDFFQKVFEPAKDDGF
jgi:hypothetical protein